MWRLTCGGLLGWASAAIGLLSVRADGTLSFTPGASAGDLGSVNCHHSFPTFLWAGSHAGERAQVGYQHTAIDASEVASMVVDSARAAQKLEIVVVVLSQGSSFSTSGVSEAHAASATPLHAKSATATFPYTYPGASTLQMVVPMMATEIGTSVQELALGEVVPTAVDTGILVDGKLDFVVVTVPESTTVEEIDERVRDVTSALEERTSGRYLLLWTGDFHDAGCGRRSLKAEASLHRRLQTEVTSSRTIKITPDILAGVLTLVLFLFIMFIALGCVGDIECPQSFATIKPASGKEY